MCRSFRLEVVYKRLIAPWLRLFWVTGVRVCLEGLTRGRSPPQLRARRRCFGALACQRSSNTADNTQGLCMPRSVFYRSLEALTAPPADDLF
jgi:hypothetical protein